MLWCCLQRVQSRYGLSKWGSHHASPHAACAGNRLSPLRRWREPRATAAASGLTGAAHGPKTDAILGYHGAGEVRTKKAHRSPAGAALWWHAQRSCHLFLASRKLRTLRRQEQAGCQQPPRTNGFRSWQQCCP